MTADTHLADLVVFCGIAPHTGGKHVGENIATSCHTDLDPRNVGPLVRGGRYESSCIRKAVYEELDRDTSRTLWPHDRRRHVCRPRRKQKRERAGTPMPSVSAM